jgi:hypothetical protein
MTDQAWLEEMAKRYPTLVGPNDTSQQPTPAAPPAPYQVASNAPVAPPLPPNQMAPGGERGPPAPAPAPAPTAPTAPTTAPPAQTGGLPRMADVPSGINRPEVRQAQQLLQRATQIELLASQTPKDLATQQAAKAAADNLRLRAQTLLQTDSVVQTQEGQFHPMTGALDKPVPHLVYDPQRHAWVDTRGATAPTYEPTQRADAVAQRDVMELGPKVANGTATPEEQAQYATAVETYRQPVLRENPVTKETVRVNTRELPAGFPEPPGIGGAPGRAPGGAGGQVVIPGLAPEQQEIERNPAAYKVAESQYTRNAETIPDVVKALRQSQDDQVRIQEMKDVLRRFSSGPGTEGRTAASAWLQRWLPSAVTGWEKESPNLSGAQAAQAFGKLSLTEATSAEQSVLGNHAGVQATKIFSAANPNVNMLDATNNSILDMKLISNQANQDYGQALLSHFSDNEKKFATTHKYDSIEQFQRDWTSQRNPQVYAGAMGAISGQPVSQWAKGLSDDEYKRALDIVSRASPSATVNAKSGRISMQPQGGQGQGGGTPVSVRTPAEAEGLQPGTRYTTPDGRTFTR